MAKVAKEQTARPKPKANASAKSRANARLPSKVSTTRSSKASAKPSSNVASMAKAASKGAPKLLSGGNPQIPKGDGDAPVQAYIAALSGWQHEVAVRLDALIERAVPGVSKAVRWNSPFYGVDGKGWFLSFHIFTRYVKVTFFAGSSLKPLPAGTSKSPEVRYADLHEGELDERQMTSWVKQAAKLPGWSP